MTHLYTEIQLKNAIKNAISIRQALINLNRIPKGGNYQVIKKAIKKYNIDTSHFLGLRHAIGKKLGPKRPIEDYLSNNFSIHSHDLKKRLIKEKYFKYQCFKCGNIEWQNVPILLELEHKDGNHSNNRLDNLLLLCPNCHALTSTYRGKNKKK